VSGSKTHSVPARSDSVCTFTCESGDWRVTNLQLQKILYLSQMFYLGLDGERLVDLGFEAWDHGPVAPKVYRQVRMFGSAPIRDVFAEARPFAAGSRRRELLVDACRDLLAMRPIELVEITHCKDGARANNYVLGMKSLRMPDAEISGEYRARFAAGQIEAN
jgi:uncharacterized phage-associated protein